MKIFRMKKRGKQVMPVTVAKAVYCTDGTTVEDKLASSKTYTAGSGISISEDGVISVTFANGDDLSYGTSSSN